MNCGVNGRRKFELVNLAKNKIFAVVACAQIASSLVSGIVIVEPANQELVSQ